MLGSAPVHMKPSIEKALRIILWIILFLLLGSARSSVTEVGQYLISCTVYASKIIRIAYSWEINHAILLTRYILECTISPELRGLPSMTSVLEGGRGVVEKWTRVLGSDSHGQKNGTRNGTRIHTSSIQNSGHISRTFRAPFWPSESGMELEY